MNPAISKKIIILSISVFVLAILAWSIYLLIPRSYIEFTTSPNRVVILIDNDKHVINNGDILTIAPGDHNIFVYEDEFNPHEEDISVKNGETYSFVTSLTALTKKAQEQLDSSTESENAAQQFGSKQETEITDRQRNMYQILRVFPIRARQYSVYSCKSVKYPKDPIILALCADLYPTYYEPDADLKPDVIKDLEWRGFDPNDYEIIWTVVPPDEV